MGVVFGLGLLLIFALILIAIRIRERQKEKALEADLTYVHDCPVCFSVWDTFPEESVLFELCACTRFDLEGVVLYLNRWHESGCGVQLIRSLGIPFYHAPEGIGVAVIQNKHFAFLDRLAEYNLKGICSRNWFSEGSQRPDFAPA